MAGVAVQRQSEQGRGLCRRRGERTRPAGLQDLVFRKRESAQHAAEFLHLTIEAIRTALETKADLQSVEGHLRAHRNLFRVDYEALFSCPEAAANRAALGAWIGTDAISEPDLRKVSSGWPDWFDRELSARVLEGTASQWWLS
ncbi:hypothetical protein [Porphyrobacter sp. CACIAM 03H1]|uniref:hypothetical protein n=1 Tax=Porphyrobacter sp. CACIAM 03H1 TaxID=2003315 RepID=UPI000B5A4778|nr:hypothetical protein [Porphyrobacter sp. CACIAM 03H1]ASJ92195.1 hypothetical protein CBR61_15510 [Porphyrobacter sp. CACIAM 03H1]